MSVNDMPHSTLGALTSSVQRRNTMADWMFYDTGSLRTDELALLSGQINREGAVLVVEPSDSGSAGGVRKFDDFDAFRAEPGELLRHFTIAGVGSSDVGAAALARGLANHLQAPVGAIVAGYGMSDLLSEAMGGWFFFGAHNQMPNAMHRFGNALEAIGDTPLRAGASGTGRTKTAFSPDTATLIRLLGEQERKIETILGHSKGCLSLSFALHAIAAQTDSSHLARARGIRIITTGAVVAFPAGLGKISQYLGTLDWFGGLNSRPGLPYHRVDGAWHHLNPRLPFHMDLQRVLAGEYDADSPG